MADWTCSGAGPSSTKKPEFMRPGELLRPPGGGGSSGGGSGGGGSSGYGSGSSGSGDGGGGGVGFFPECYVMPRDRARFAAATAS